MKRYIWEEMSYNKYKCESMHNRLCCESLRYNDCEVRIDYELDDNDEDELEAK